MRGGPPNAILQYFASLAAIIESLFLILQDLDKVSEPLTQSIKIRVLGLIGKIQNSLPRLDLVTML